jgi:long-subunit fatty acid transport protein
METFGAGAGSTAMGGGGLAFPMDAGAVFLNPASLVRLPGQHGATVGYQLIRSEFPDFPALWWDTNRDGLVDAADEPLRIQPDYNAGDGVFVGATDKLGKRFGFGIAVFVPKDYILRLATFEPELPIYFMYDTRLQRYAMAAGFGWEQFPGVSVGGGVQLIPQARYSIVATIDATFTGAIEGDTEAWQLMRSLTLDVHEMTLDLVPGFAPMASLDWNVGRSIPALRGLYVAASWRGALGLPVDVRGDLQGNIRVEDAGDLGAVLFPLAVKVGLGVWDHYLPEQVSGGLGLELFDSLRLYGDLRWTRWSRMPVNITRVIEASVDAPFFEVDPSNIHDGNDAVAVFRDTFSLRAGGEIRLPRWDVGPPFDHVRLHLRGGAGLEPSPLLEQTVATALLDADRAVLAGGIGVEHRDPFGWVGETRWNVFGQFQRLGRGALERPVLSQPTPGQPIQADADDMTRIEIGGRLWTTGLQLDFEY